jgi:hypothetical protein
MQLTLILKISKKVTSEREPKSARNFEPSELLGDYVQR